MPRALPIALCLGALALAACGSDDGDGGATQARGQQQGTTVAGCRAVSAPRPKREVREQRPTGPLPSGRAFRVRMETSCGAFTIRIDQRSAPRAAASFGALARRGFFDGTAFHRIVPRFVIQGGDPTGRGSGGPGYSTRDVPPRDTRYTRGVVAMAKTAEEPPGTAGSQFYVVIGADAGLPPEYAVLGRVAGGMGVVERIGRLGDPNSGQQGVPTEPVVLEKATVSES